MNDVQNENNKLISNRDLAREKVGATAKTETVNNVVFEEWNASLYNMRHSMAQWQIFISINVTNQSYKFRQYMQYHLLQKDHYLYNHLQIIPCL